MIFATPDLNLEDLTVLEQIHSMRRELDDVLRTPRRWEGGLRRSMVARAIRGSNSIEGYHVEMDDAVAALDEEAPLSADERTFAEIRGYRQALGYVLSMAGDDDFTLDASAIRSMHFMMLSHDLAKSPGRYRQGPVYVYDEGEATVVYEGPDAPLVPGLMEELVTDLALDNDVDLLLRASMAHLNLVMVHPFRDGNGRMARALQTLVLSRGGIAEPAFSSIEEWLGANTDDYYRVLAITGAGSWHPDGDCGLWLSFNLRAHHMQAQTMLRRFRQANALWAALDELAAEYSFSERITSLLFDALLGYRLRRSTHVKRAEIEERTATRDFKRLVDLGFLRTVGETRGRHYVAAPRLQTLRENALADTERRVEDPYPWLRATLLNG
jgi:Fic family protein